MRRIDLTTVRIAFGLALSLSVAAAFAGCSASAPDSSEIKTKFEEVLAPAKGCDVLLERDLQESLLDSQCVLVYPGCPLGQFESVHREQAITVNERARALLREYARKDQSCSYVVTQDPAPVAFCNDRGECDIKEPGAPPPAPDAGE